MCYIVHNCDYNLIMNVNLQVSKPILSSPRFLSLINAALESDLLNSSSFQTLMSVWTAHVKMELARISKVDSCASAPKVLTWTILDEYAWVCKGFISVFQ